MSTTSPPGDVIERMTLDRYEVQSLHGLIRAGQRKKAVAIIAASSGATQANAERVYEHLAPQIRGTDVDLLEITAQDVVPLTRRDVTRRLRRADPIEEYLFRDGAAMHTSVAEVERKGEEPYFCLPGGGTLPVAKANQIWRIQPRPRKR